MVEHVEMRLGAHTGHGAMQWSLVLARCCEWDTARLQPSVVELCVRALRGMKNTTRTVEGKATVAMHCRELGWRTRFSAGMK